MSALLRSLGPLLRLLLRHPLALSAGAAIGSLFGLTGFGGALAGAVPGAVLGLMFSVASAGGSAKPAVDSKVGRPDWRRPDARTGAR